MGILDSIKKTAADSLKTAATDTIRRVAAASSSKAAEAVIAKAATLVGSKATGAMPNTPPASVPNAASPNAAAAAKAAALVGSKAAPTGQSYAQGGANVLSSAEVEAIIEAKVKAKGNPSNWRISIVDLMTALDMNSSLDSRRVLAAKLNYSGSAPDGSAEKNLWIHAELLKALAQNRGEVPSYLR